MPVKVAVASQDGRTVDQHFGQATQFVIYEVAGSVFRVLEHRTSQPSCGTAASGHDEDRMQQTVELIADCRAVLVARIGPAAERRLAARGIEAFMVPTFIDRAMQRLAASGMLERTTPGVAANFRAVGR
ncbi:MAG: NifB/NifX family molybdenum-iron cluster-binding protein [Azospirillaceae bacterium]|nr:NifB/NifX family molybdenum-iron cluster-binding protein [Azospirillaceae bacterium]